MPTSQHKSVEERFDREAGDWRDVYSRTEANPFQYHDKLYRRHYVLEMIGTGNGLVLDLGCGAGMFFRDLEKAGFAVVGADFSAEMTALAAESDEGHAGVLRADALALPVRSGAFQALIGVGLLEYLPEDNSPMAEIFRILKPGGIVVVTLRNSRCLERRLWRIYTRIGLMERPSQGFYREHDVDEFRSAVLDAGFTSFEYRYCHFYPLPWPFSRAFAKLNNYLAHRWEKWFSKKHIPWLGSTIICRFTKPAVE
jgi:SAM-dependent methyltransferase